MKIPQNSPSLRHWRIVYRAVAYPEPRPSHSAGSDDSCSFVSRHDCLFGLPPLLMSSDSSGGEEFVAGTPAKSRQLLPARCTTDGGRFARASSSLARPAEARAALPLAAPAACVPALKPDAAFQRVVPSAGLAAAAPRPAALATQQPLAGRYSAPSLTAPTAQWGGQGLSLLQRGAGGFSRIAQERQNAHGALLEARAPPHRSELDFSAAAAVGGGRLATFAAPQLRVEARCARVAGFRFAVSDTSSLQLHSSHRGC